MFEFVPEGFREGLPDVGGDEGGAGLLLVRIPQHTEWIQDEFIGQLFVGQTAFSAQAGVQLLSLLMQQCLLLLLQLKCCGSSCLALPFLFLLSLLFFLPSLHFSDVVLGEESVLCFLGVSNKLLLKMNLARSS